jgi:hypothetical protein
MGMSRTSPLKNAGKPNDDVRNCTDDLCPLYDFRFGKNPHLKGGKGNPEALKKYIETKKLS